MSFSTSNSSLYKPYSSNNPFRKNSTQFYQTSAPSLTSKAHPWLSTPVRIDFLQLPVNTNRPGHAIRTPVHPSRQNTITNIMTVMTAIVTSDKSLEIGSPHGGTPFNHTMVNLPPHDALDTFFVVDRSDLSAREYGILSCFCLIGTTDATKHEQMKANILKSLGGQVAHSLKVTNATIRHHVFASYDTKTIGSLFFRSSKTTHRPTAAKEVRTIIQAMEDETSDTPTVVPVFELDNRQLPSTIHENAHPRPKTLQVLCDRNDADVLELLLTTHSIDRIHGLFAPFSASTNLNTNYYGYLTEHLEFIAQLDTFQVHGLHYDVLHGPLPALPGINIQTGKPQTVWGILTEYAYNDDDHFISLIDELHSAGADGRWTFSAQTATLEQAMDHVAHIMETYATQTPTYEDHVKHSEGFQQGIKILTQAVSSSSPSHPSTQQRHSTTPATPTHPFAPPQAISIPQHVPGTPISSEIDTPSVECTTQHSRNHIAHPFARTTQTTESSHQESNTLAPQILGHDRDNYPIHTQDPTRTNRNIPHGQATTHTLNHKHRNDVTYTPKSPESITEKSAHSAPITHLTTLEDMQHKVLSLEQEISSLQNDIDWATQEASEAQKKMDNTTAKHKDEMEILSTESQKHRDRANKATARMKEYQDRTTKQATKINDLEAQIDEHNAAITVIQTQHSLLLERHDQAVAAHQRDMKAEKRKTEDATIKYLESCTKVKILETLIDNNGLLVPDEYFAADKPNTPIIGGTKRLPAKTPSTKTSAIPATAKGGKVAPKAKQTTSRQSTILPYTKRAALKAIVLGTKRKVEAISVPDSPPLTTPPIIIQKKKTNHPIMELMDTQEDEEDDDDDDESEAPHPTEVKNR